MQKKKARLVCEVTRRGRGDDALPNAAWAAQQAAGSEADSGGATSTVFVASAAAK